MLQERRCSLVTTMVIIRPGDWLSQPAVVLMALDPPWCLVHDPPLWCYRPHKGLTPTRSAPSASHACTRAACCLLAQDRHMRGGCCRCTLSGGTERSRVEYHVVRAEPCTGSWGMTARNGICTHQNMFIAITTVYNPEQLKSRHGMYSRVILQHFNLCFCFITNEAMGCLVWIREDI